jgi:hypothetical protein
MVYKIKIFTIYKNVARTKCMFTTAQCANDRADKTLYDCTTVPAVPPLIFNVYFFIRDVRNTKELKKLLLAHPIKPVMAHYSCP